MRNLRVQSIKPINKVLSTYPNLYFKLHEGIADPNVATITCESTGIPLAVETPGATQWGTTYGNFEPVAGNTNQKMSISDLSSYATEFDAVAAGLNTGAWMIMLNMDYVRDATVGQVVLSIRDQAQATNVLELRLNADVGQLKPVLYDSNGNYVSRANPVTDAENEQTWAVYVDMRPGVKTSTVFRYDPGTKVLNSTAPRTLDISGANFITAASDADAGAITIGARKTGLTSYSNYVDAAGLRDMRFINFGSSPPTDIVNLIEELAINSNAGTRREY